MIFDFKLDRSQIFHTGRNLSRPESVLAERDGTLWASDTRAALTCLKPDGTQKLVGSMKGRPNGFCIDVDGAFCVANIEQGRFYRVDRDGREEILLDQFDGQALGAANFAYCDQSDRCWLTVSTVTVPRRTAIDRKIADGYVLQIDAAGPRKVLDNLFFVNEIRFDRSGRYLYLVETSASRIRRAELKSNGVFGDLSVFGPDPIASNAQIDGIAFDADDNLWATDVKGNRIFVLSPEGHVHTLFEDREGSVMRAPSCIAFAGPDLKTVHIGSIEMDCLASFESPVAGAPMRHWTNG